MRPPVLVFILLCSWSFPVCLSAQNAQANLSTQITRPAFANYISKEPAKRKFMDLSSKKTAARYNPVTYVSAGLLFFYQRVISPQLQANCTYEISCSEYTKLCIQHYGFVKGTLLGLHQLNNCAPGVIGDRCRYVISPDGKIINHIDHE
jgi:putative component of membrane protein insertase Oxa1/YidC/SpoIIIJ protein YidD